MKKSWHLLVAALLVSSGMAGAQQPQKSAKSGPPVTSVKAAAGAADERRVQLSGKIVAHQGKNVYLFEDDTGKIPIVIGGKAVQPGQKLGPGVPVDITGHVDRPAKGGPRVMVSSARIVFGRGTKSGD
jgi:uncharacterized protein (TIGR00156 family)